ncbi:DUF2254 domain-containing protein [Actinotalea sp. AC32]|nr:DUF2254 domain-containing protein [Actinotalea sp. AC32]
MAAPVRLRQRFWFLPALMCAGAVLLAEGLVAVDRAGGAVPPWADAVLLRVGESGSREVLGAIATASLSVAGTTFSITMAVLALTSSAYGPRLVPSFMADRGNQAALGAYTATFLYALLVLRSVRVLGDPGDQQAEVFVPHLAVNVAVLLAVANVAVLVWFIHHISDSIQVWTLSGRVRESLCDVVDSLYPESLATDPAEVPEEPRVRLPDPATDLVVTADRPGYVELVEEDEVARVARRRDVLVALRVSPGDHVLPSEPLAVVAGPGARDHADEVVAAVRGAVHVGDARNAVQDVAFVVQQLVDMAVRALSPGTNDPTTAVNAVDDLAAGLALLVHRRLPSPLRLDDEGTPLVHAPRPEPVELVRSVLQAVRWYGSTHPQVVSAGLRLARRVGTAARDQRVRAVVDDEVGLLLDGVRDAGLHPRDVARLEAEAGDVRALLR